jgi:hypothetical protein
MAQATRRQQYRNMFGSGIGPTGLGGMQGGAGTAQDAAGGLYAPPAIPALGIDFSKPSTWSALYFGIAVFWLVFIYSAHGGRRGGIL